MLSGHGTRGTAAHMDNYYLYTVTVDIQTESIDEQRADPGAGAG